MSDSPTSIIQNALDTLQELAGDWYAIMNGGPTEMVDVGDRQQPTLAKMLADLAAQITTGFEAGFVVVVANATARGNSTPSQAYQLLIQADTKAIYYAPSTVTGSWVIHPLQSALQAAEDATTAVNSLTLSLNGKMSATDYVGGVATGVVRSAERIKALVDFAAANPNASLRVYGVENGAYGLFVPPQVIRAEFLTGGVNSADPGSEQTTLTNCVRNGLGNGCNFALVGNPLRCLSWGSQDSAGVLGSGLTANQSFQPRLAVATQQPDRNLPGFDPVSLATVPGQVVRIQSQVDCTVIQTADGIILVAGSKSKGNIALFGSGVDKVQHVFMPIYFNDGGTNKKIVQFDVCNAMSSNHGTGIFVDETNGIWLLTTNPANAGYGNGLSGQILTPRKLNAGFPSWTGKTPKKVRCDPSGNIYILFTNGELWAGGGANTSGQMGTGGTTAILNPLQIRTGVTDFEVSGNTAAANQALWTLEGTTLRAAGYNANGQMNQGVLTNRPSFVQVATNVNFVRIGGTDNVTVIYRNTSDDWFGVGRNTDGCFGQGVSVTNNATAVTLTNLKTLLENNGGLTSLCISGYKGRHSTCVVTGNGKAFTCGNNIDGVLANGYETSQNTWQTVLWTPRDATEKIIDVSSCVAPTDSPAFTWLTNFGRILQAGAADRGFATGVSPPASYNVLTATPVRIDNAA